MKQAKAEAQRITHVPQPLARATSSPALGAIPTGLQLIDQAPSNHHPRRTPSPDRPYTTLKHCQRGLQAPTFSLPPSPTPPIPTRSRIKAPHHHRRRPAAAPIVLTAPVGLPSSTPTSIGLRRPTRRAHNCHDVLWMGPGLVRRWRREAEGCA
jgi:hypothetical protein